MFKKVQKMSQLLGTKKQRASSGWVDQLIGALSRKLKGFGFDSGQGTYLGCWFVHAKGNRLMFLSHIAVSLPLCLPPFPSLKSVSMSLGED